mmetsp:Transcript_17621/g.31068  ORF Transcript_17621/g.31068 Transcript_17621/m.31068 type:complete len:251 (-) Transcript_17621:584-1336(-)|eukprot:CAMPEP_0184523742 /NCGR_PEP_ID=MMETSP0198_2-20121128/9077_1 /TAXON_ID=1112570 /ORGANISM="Thraustochytrium sp., Strain LLF1b" /LENGTH=250 /DNA_ID=CAMNT_0026914855 /DNA_START=30 /DNA_END=782 /DNA_ORIENTATION=+
MSWDDDDWESGAAPLPPLPGTAAAAPAVTEDAFSDEEAVTDDDMEATEKPKPRKPGDSSKAKAKALSKAKQKDLQKQLEAEAEALKAATLMTKEEKIAEKARLQKLVEEADHELTNELFGVKKEEGKLDVDAILSLLMSIPLETEEDYINLGQAVGRRIEVEDKPFLAKEFLKEVGRHVGRNIPGEDLAEVISLMGVVKNEKVKTQLNKKKKKAGKKFANVARNNDFDLDGSDMARGGGAFDAGLDGDFM